MIREIKGVVLKVFVRNIGTIGSKEWELLIYMFFSIRIQWQQNEEKQQACLIEAWTLPGTEECLHADDIQTNNPITDFIYFSPRGVEHWADQDAR